MQKKKKNLILLVKQDCIPPLSLKAHVPKVQSALIGRLIHAWATTAHHVSGRLCHVFSFHLESLQLWI